MAFDAEKDHAHVFMEKKIKSQKSHRLISNQRRRSRAARRSPAHFASSWPSSDSHLLLLRRRRCSRRDIRPDICRDKLGYCTLFPLRSDLEIWRLESKRTRPPLLETRNPSLFERATWSCLVRRSRSSRWVGHARRSHLSRSSLWPRKRMRHWQNNGTRSKLLQSINQRIDQSNIILSIDQSINQSINQSIDWSIAKTNNPKISTNKWLELFIRIKAKLWKNYTRIFPDQFWWNSLAYRISPHSP